MRRHVMKPCVAKSERSASTLLMTMLHEQPTALAEMILGFWDQSPDQVEPSSPENSANSGS